MISNSDPSPVAPSIDLSIVVPFYNEEESAMLLLKEIDEVMSGLNMSYEVVAIDDGSTDQTPQLLSEWVTQKDQHQLLTLARNYGQTAALSAGFNAVQGRLVLPMDGDGQNDPHDIPHFLEQFSDDVDLISGWRKKRAETSLKRTLPSKTANWLISKLSGVQLHDYGCTMKLYRQEHVKAMRLYGEMHRFIPIFAHQEGARIIELVVNHRPRTGGASKYGLERTFKVIMDLLLIKFFTSLQEKPIYLFGGIGLFASACGAFFLFWAFILKLISVFAPDTPWGRDLVETPLLVAGLVLIMLGMMTALMGILTDLSMRTYYESQNKFPYRIKSRSSS